MKPPEKPDRTTGEVRPVTSVVLTLLTLIGLLIGALFYLLTILYFWLGFLDLQIMWHLFVLVYTLAMPPMSLFSVIVYHLRPSRTTAFVSLLFAIGTLAIWLVWSAEASRGITH